jgi:transcriptional regulator with XRE-family HTH domain
MDRKIVNMPPRFRTRLREKRDSHNISRRQLMKDTDISYQGLINLETKALARIEAETVVQLMKVFNCEMSDLVYIVDES